MLNISLLCWFSGQFFLLPVNLFADLLTNEEWLMLAWSERGVLKFYFLFFFPIYFFKQIVKVNHLFRRVLFSSISWLVFLSNNHMESIQHLPVIHSTFSLRNTSQNILVFVNYSLNIRLFLWLSWKNNSFPNLWLLLMYFKSLTCNINLYNFRNATVIYFSISFFVVVVVLMET